MEEVKGVITMLGDSINTGQLTKYTHIEIDGKILKKIIVPIGLNGKMHEALESGERVTLWIKHRFVGGVRISEGRTYVADGTGVIHVLLGVFIFLFTLFAAIFFSAFIIGLPIFYLVWKIFQRIQVMVAVNFIPDGIAI